MTTQDSEGTDRCRETTGHQNVPISASYGGTTFHLYQLVYTPDPRDKHYPKAWVVVDLQGRLKLSDLRFDESKSLTEEEVRNSRITPETAATGTPVFGY
ncbi:hypothetical protein [Halorubrum sp. AJ67]|uniref:hypothetical protein n=1 Tax=Halorubrum sp. AJ67 TaxID=1173487 RepID=UPI0003DDEFF0|nr:hypothetical protein [Halorubrum sp. AJ67]CDK38058.1 hypothetical protein BN903_258 [Halorubrum sp. AJ67]